MEFSRKIFNCAVRGSLAHLEKYTQIFLVSCNMSPQKELRRQIYDMVGQVENSVILNVFLNKKVSRATIYRIIKECKDGEPLIKDEKRGRKPLLNPQKQKKMIKMAENKIGVSIRKLGRKFNVSHTTIVRNVKKSGLQFRKRRKTPKYTEKQLLKIKKNCHSLRTKHLRGDKVIVMDDEKYFTFSNSTNTGNNGFYTSDFQNTPDKVKFAGKDKFEKKVLVWCAISSAGISEPFIGHVRGEAVNADVYISKCLPKLKTFIQLNHINDDFVFWPDLASCHYAKKTTDWLKANNINFIPKIDNPPNVPQARPIENFWAILSRLVYENGWEAKTEKQLRRRIFKKLREVDIKVVQGMMEGIKSKLRKIEDAGPLSIM
jgi:transposase